VCKFCKVSQEQRKEEKLLEKKVTAPFSKKREKTLPKGGPQSRVVGKEKKHARLEGKKWKKRPVKARKKRQFAAITHFDKKKVNPTRQREEGFNITEANQKSPHGESQSPAKSAVHQSAQHNQYNGCKYLRKERDNAKHQKRS